MSVSYNLRDDLKTLTVCLYNPSGQTEETQFTFSTLWNYLHDCSTQIERGEKIKRYPYHVSPCLADAYREKENLKQALSKLRKDRTNI